MQRQLLTTLAQAPLVGAGSEARAWTWNSAVEGAVVFRLLITVADTADTATGAAGGRLERRLGPPSLPCGYLCPRLRAAGRAAVPPEFWTAAAAVLPGNRAGGLRPHQQHRPRIHCRSSAASVQAGLSGSPVFGGVQLCMPGSLTRWLKKYGVSWKSNQICRQSNTTAGQRALAGSWPPLASAT